MSQLKKNKITLLILALINVIILSIGHAYNNQILLWGTLLFFLGITVFSHKKYFLPLMLFYLPWSPVLKTNPNTFTFFTLIVPFVFLLIVFEEFKKKSKYKIEHIFLPLFFIAYTLLIKLVNGIPISTSYLFFIMMLFFIPIYVQKYKNDINFETCTLFITTGVLTACIAAKILMNFPHMLVYIDVYTWDKIGLTRLSGFYGDANFYSTHILIAIASLFLVLNKTKRKILIVLQLVSIIALLYYGMLSVSKMFIFCAASIVLLWAFSLVLAKRNFSYKLGITLAILLVVGITIGSNLFTEQLNLYLLRFGMVTDTQSLTTGRSELFDMYINYLLSNIDSLFFGNGLSDVFINGKSSHNTLIQIIYQVGVFGLFFIIIWWRTVYSTLSNKIKLNSFGKYKFLMILIAYFFPWLSLEMLHFDEFFYISILAILAKNYLSTPPEMLKTE